MCVYMCVRMCMFVYFLAHVPWLKTTENVLVRGLKREVLMMSLFGAEEGILSEIFGHAKLFKSMERSNRRRVLIRP